MAESFNAASHGAIQTEYAGCLFRSRLEARWAVFFDALGIKWQYELQGYECGGHRYLPDFYLPRSNDFVEVKGDPKGLQNDFDRMRSILSPKSPLPGFADGKTSLILLGDIPRVTNETVFHKRIFLDERSIFSGWVSFVPMMSGAFDVAVVEKGLLSGLFRLKQYSELENSSSNEGWVVDHKSFCTACVFHPVLGAYSTARKARFEHGERGAV